MSAAHGNFHGLLTRVGTGDDAFAKGRTRAPCSQRTTRSRNLRRKELLHGGGSPEPLLLPKQRCCCSASASKQLSPAVSNPGLFVIFKEGPGGIPGIFFSKINRTLDLFHQKKKKKKRAGAVPGGDWAGAWGRGCCCRGGRETRSHLPSSPRSFFHQRAVKVTKGTKQRSVASPGGARRVRR